MLKPIKLLPRLIYFLLGLGFFFLTIWLGYSRLDAHWQAQKRQQLSLEGRVELSWQIAETKLKQTIDYLQTDSLAGRIYPEYTENGKWTKARPNSWSAGFFPAALWKMSLHAKDKAYWQENAKKWSDTLRYRVTQVKDMTVNNLFVFAPWFEQAEGVEKATQLQTILLGARELEKNFHPGIGTLGVLKKANRDQQVYWQSFIDHIINVEQLLWSAEQNPNQEEGQKWRAQALSHIKTLGRTFGNKRNPGRSGTWQRGYFQQRQNAPDYRKFLFNEGKQGWRDDSTWSRGQAWVIYGASLAYQYTHDREVLAIAKEQIDYFLSHLGADGVAPWDFDYAQKHPQTNRDSSANAIALAGILKLLPSLPSQDQERGRYTQAVKTLLLALTSWDYLSEPSRGEMSILLHGCYHHPQSLSPSPVDDNGLIWGDYFFLDALWEYENLGEPHGSHPLSSDRRF